MPVKTGIHLCLRFKFKKSLDSGLRRNDGIRVDCQSKNSQSRPLEAKGSSIPHRREQIAKGRPAGDVALLMRVLHEFFQHDSILRRKAV